MGKKKQNLLGVYALLASSSYRDDYGTFVKKNPPKRPKKKIIPKGLKEFNYNGNIVHALNQKNADRKALKRGYTTKQT